MKIFKNGFLFIKFIFKVRAVNRENGSYHRYVNKITQNELAKSHQFNDGSISQLHFLKIQWYMATNLYLGELLAELRPRHLTLNEKRSLIYLGALMAITDLMVDDHQLGYKRVSLLLNGETIEPNRSTAIEKVFILYYEKLLSGIDDEKKQLIKDFTMLKPQIESHLQLNEPVSEAAIHKLTREKGGTAILLTTSFLIKITEKNKEAFLQLGAFIQYLNDSQDFIKDKKNGITTFISFCSTFDDVNQKLTEEFDLTRTLLCTSGFPESKVYELLFYIHALYVGIQYKNQQLARRISNSIDFEKLPLMKRATFELQMFSMRSIIFCVPRILVFKTPTD